MTSKKQKSTFNYKSLSLILGAITLCLAVATAYLFCNKPSHEESKRLQAFESLAALYINQLYLTKEGENAQLTDVGITDDDDLYLDYEITQFNEEHLPLAHRPARLHFQCKDSSGKERTGKVAVADITEMDGCAAAWWYGDWTELSK